MQSWSLDLSENVQYAEAFAMFQLGNKQPHVAGIVIESLNRKQKRAAFEFFILRLKIKIFHDT